MNKISKIGEIKIILLAALALIVLVSLISFDPEDISFLTSNPNAEKQNIVGFVGAYFAWFLFLLMGYGAYSVPFFIILWGINTLLGDKPQKLYIRVFGVTLSIIAASSLFSMLGVSDVVYSFHRGGIIGLIFSNFLLKYLGTVGTFIVITVLFLLSLLITTDFLIFPFLGWLPRAFKNAISFLRHMKRKPAPGKEPPEPRRLRNHSATYEVAEVAAAVKAVKLLKEEEYRAAIKVMPKEVKETPLANLAIPSYNAPYSLPSLDLLTMPPPIEEREIIKESVEENSKILEETLQDFGIEAKVVGVSTGPVITRYELEPARGVTVQRITSLSDNIALSMKSVSIRVVAPIPGRGTIGVEVPNLKSSLVYLKEILESDEYRNKGSKLKLALGKDISGAPIVADLDDMPHLLIAGATGSGKTVCVNSIITSLLYNASPLELKFLMVDPKRVELAAFNNLPHLLAPVVTEPKKVSHALNWLVNEMERRYGLFAEIGVRNIASYNKKVESENLQVIPYIIVIIDELADLMLVAQQDVENMITRLAQLSRAVGIHMIIATQRPSVDVITGVIKANFPARISFKVATKVDSRTVIDMNGAEKLLGRGDMLFIQPGNPKPVRAQGSLVGDDEIARMSSFIKSQMEAHFEEGIVQMEEKPKYKRFEKDEIYEEAVRLVMETKQASVSMLQRRLGVGYTRAARLIDMMEDESIIGPYQGSKPRDILLKEAEDKKV